MLDWESLGQGVCSESRDWTASRRIRSLVKSLAEGAETSGPAVPVFATAAPASRRPRGRQDYRRQAMASKSVNRIENPPRDATYADFLESNPEPATSVIPRACGRVFGAIAGGEPLNVVVPRWMGLMCEDQLLCVAQCAPHMRSLPDDNVRRATEVPRSMREAGVRPLSVEERFGDVGSVLREQSVQAIPLHRPRDSAVPWIVLARIAANARRLDGAKLGSAGHLAQDSRHVDRIGHRSIEPAPFPSTSWRTPPTPLWWRPKRPSARQHASPLEVSLQAASGLRRAPLSQRG